jgi:transcriptional regulator with XRE-family HTH domain
MELRRLREAAGLSVRAASQGLSVDQSKISHLEAGRTGVGAERLRGMAAHYACLDIGFIDALVAMTGERPRQWWDAFRGKLGQSAIDLAELEHHASAVRMFQAAYVPGLLQTEDYMRAVLSYAVPEPSPQELDVLVSFRLQRRHVLDRDGAPPFQAVIHEAALRTRVTDRMAACDQLSYLVEQSERPNVTVRVVPFDTDYFGGLGYSILYAQGAVPRLDTVHVDALPGAVWLDSEDQLAKYRALLDKVTEVALPAAESRDFIHYLAREM